VETPAKRREDFKMRLSLFAPLGRTRAILLVLRSRDGIDTGLPAMMVNIGTALGTERPQVMDRGLAADRAWPQAL
jgi:hypothetical protein